MGKPGKCCSKQDQPPKEPDHSYEERTHVNRRVRIGVGVEKSESGGYQVGIKTSADVERDHVVKVDGIPLETISEEVPSIKQVMHDENKRLGDIVIDDGP